MTLQKRFENFLSESGCIPEGRRLLVAVSGGADSVALLHLLQSAAERLGFELEVAHLDHALREESAEDAAFVEELCAGLNIPVVVERQDVQAVAHERKGNLEEVARDLRRDFLDKVRQVRSCDLIVLGQHADDQAETFLLRLLRGAGSAGLSGMKYVNGRIVRPLLSFHKHELIAYLKEQGLNWREDSSNRDLRFTRNRIRHELLPVLKSYNPNISSQLAGYCEQLRQDEQFWTGLVAEQLSLCGHRIDDHFVLDLEHVKGLASALSGRVIRKALEEIRGDLRGISAGHIADIQDLIHAGPVQGELDLPRAWIARRYDKLVIHPERPAAPESFEIQLPGPGCYDLPDARKLIVSIESDSMNEHVDAVEFNAEELTFPLVVRHCRPGDRFQPSGMSGSKKIQDLFVDLKISREGRRDALLLLSRKEVLWVVGTRRSEMHRPQPGKDVLRVTIES